MKSNQLVICLEVFNERNIMIVFYTKSVSWSYQLVKNLTILPATPTVSDVLLIEFKGDSYYTCGFLANNYKETIEFPFSYIGLYLTDNSVVSVDLNKLHLKPGIYLIFIITDYLTIEIVETKYQPMHSIPLTTLGC